MKVITPLILCFLTNIAFAQVEIKGSPQEVQDFVGKQQDTVSLSATGEVKVTSDHAFVSLSVRTEHGSLEKAVANGNRVQQKIQSALAQAGIKAEDIKTSSISNTPSYGLFGKKPSSYEVSNSISIKITSQKHFVAIARLVDSHDEVFYGGIKYGHTKSEAHKTKAIVNAMNKLSQRKGIYEQNLGVRLTPKTFSEGGINIVQPTGGMGYKRSRNSKGLSSVSWSSNAPTVAMVGNTMESLTYTMKINVTYLVTTK